jgi:hypothetical protein
VNRMFYIPTSLKVGIAGQILGNCKSHLRPTEIGVYCVLRCLSLDISRRLLATWKVELLSVMYALLWVVIPETCSAPSSRVLSVE